MKQKPVGVDMTDYMATKAEERNDAYTIVQVRTWPKVTDIVSPVYLGSFSWTLTAEKKRLVYEPTALYPFGVPQTPGEIVRDYLDWKYPRKLRCTKSQHAAITHPRSFPRMAHKCELEHGVYIDLKSAWWSIVRAVGWDVDYFPGKFIGVSSNVNDFPLQENKPARSALVTAGLSNPVRLWTGKRLIWKTTNNLHINYGLWAIVHDVLHGIASDMQEVGAVYVHTDGYILPGDRVGEALDVVSSWGLKCGIKGEGATKVFGVGVYTVGGVKTKRRRAVPVKDHVHVEPQFKGWLRSKFRLWAERAR